MNLQNERLYLQLKVVAVNALGQFGVLDLHDLTGDLSVRAIDQNAVGIDDVDNDGQTIGVGSVLNVHDAANLDKFLEHHREVCCCNEKIRDRFGK